MTTDDGYAAWLRAKPAPDLQELVRKHGGYDKITPEAWAEYDRVLAEWQEAKRSRHAGGDRTSNVPNENNVVTTQGTAVVADPEALCICGLPGVYWRPRKGGGRLAVRRASRSLAGLRGRSVRRPAADFENSINACYAVIRARRRAGGEGWESAAAPGRAARRSHFWFLYG
jgi:hypothetical protein